MHGNAWVDASWFAQWRQGNVYVTSDLHLGHERIIELCDRPFGSVGQMNDEILDGINAVVKNQDTLVICGDIVMGKLELTMRMLRRIKAARIWLLPGNHDRFSLAFKHGGAVEVRRGKRAMWQAQYEGVWSDNRGRPRTTARVRSVRVEPDVVSSAWLVPLAGQRVLMSHYPYVGDSDELKKDRYAELRPRDTGLPWCTGTCTAPGPRTADVQRRRRRARLQARVGGEDPAVADRTGWLR